MIAADEGFIKGKMKQLGMLMACTGPRHTLLGLTVRNSKDLKDPRTSYNHIKVLPH